MRFWGLAIDTSAAVLLSVALGLAVDYSAHIAHAFITKPGNSRDQRIQKVVVEIGPAVFNGGFSTFLAFSILMISKLYVFKVFFKIFFLVVVFGLYYGLIVLPVILSLVGPSAISPSRSARNAITPKENIRAISNEILPSTIPAKPSMDQRESLSSSSTL